MAFWGKQVQKGSKKGQWGKTGKFGNQITSWSGKGQNWSESWHPEAPEWEGPATWERDYTTSSQSTKRIQNRFQMVHELLRPSADKDGSAFVKKFSKMSDDKLLSAEVLKDHMTADTTHLIRRPGTGISEACGSIESALEMLKRLRRRP